MNGALDGVLDQLNVATHRYLRKNAKLYDGIFQNDPFAAYIKKNCIEKFPGGRVIAENITYDTLLGGGYSEGEDFDLSEQQTDQQIQFFVKQLEANVSMTLEEIEVLNNGPAMIFKTLDSKMKNAYNSIGSWLAISLYLKNGTTGYSKLITGLAEAINDGSNPSWDGVTTTSYGGITRSTMNGALSAKNTSLNGAQIEYGNLEDSLTEASWGEGEFEPNIGVTTPKAMTSMKTRFQTQQTLNEREPVLGFRGFSVGNATLMKSRYCPGQDIATAGTKANRVATKFLRYTSRGGVTTYPAVSGETLYWLNARREYLKLYTSTSPLFSFGFTGFKVSAGNTKVSGQVLWAGQMVIPQVSYHGELHNFI